MNQANDHKQIVYCIPGLGASKTIFEFLPKSDQLSYVLLDQKFPTKGESFDSYINRWSVEIKDENPIVIGVSFGGIIAQELSKSHSIKKTILISSVRTPLAYPWFLKLLKYIGVHSLVMPFILSKMKQIEQNPKTAKDKKMSPLLKRYLPNRDLHYIKWSVDKIICWKPTYEVESLIQIHGTKDEIFPYSKTKNAISIKDGTHAMIVTKRRWFEENLLSYILN